MITRQAVSLRNYINGQWTASQSAQRLHVRNPATDDVVASFPDATREETAQAVQSAEQAWPRWRATPPLDRARLLMKLKALIEQHRADISRTLTLEHGKTFRESQLELDRAIENIEVATSVTTAMQGRVLEDAAAGIDEYSIRQPLGVTASLNPFNFPAMIPFWSMPYALACGNCVIVKASPRVPMTMARIFELIDQTGFPAGVVNLLLGATAAADELLQNPNVKAISFVGSTRAGREVYRKAADAGKRVQVQAGAKNFGIVMPDAPFDKIIPNLIASAMDCSGQRCLALATVITVDQAYEPVRDGILRVARSRRLGFGMDEGAEMGPVISRESQQRIEGCIDQAIRDGAKAPLDGRGAEVEGYSHGYWIGPTILDNCHREMPAVNEEIFGPVVCILRAANLDEALDIIHRNPYGNAASIFTSDGATARRFRHEARCGNLGINIGVAAPMAFFPFGGSKASFFGDLHAQGEDAFRFFTNAVVCVERWF